jgi:hypothetical protein
MGQEYEVVRKRRAALLGALRKEVIDQIAELNRLFASPRLAGPCPFVPGGLTGNQVGILSRYRYCKRGVCDPSAKAGHWATGKAGSQAGRLI